MSSQPDPRDPALGDPQRPTSSTEAAASPAVPEPATSSTTASDAPGDDDAAPADTKPSLWDDPRMPWSGTPTKQDKGCFAAIIGIGLYSLGTLPFRPVLLTAAPIVLAAVTGSSLALASIGADTGINGGWLWIVALLVATVSIVKFDWIYWWAGKLWGQGLIDYLMQDRSARAKRHADRAQRLAKKYEVLAMAATYIPFVPLPNAVIYGALGIAGTRLRKFLFLDLLFALISRSIYFTLGFIIGQPVVDALRTFGDYAWYVSIALVVGIFVVTFVRQSRKAKQEAEAAETAETKS